MASRATFRRNYSNDDETPDGESGGFYAGKNTQHCVGYIILQINESGGGTPWPGIDNDDELLERLEGRVDRGAPVFETVEDFLMANETARQAGMLGEGE